YVGSGDYELYQLNASNVSQKIASFTAGEVESFPAVANGYVYVGSGFNLYQLNASNVSQKIAEYTTGGVVYSSPAVANGYIYIGSWDHKLYQFGTDNNLLGTDTNVPSGSHATYEWSGLYSGKTYYWFVNLTDGEYDTESLIWSFTTS
ncbi:MAG: PQQ-binding-like beta-propeller repeat protein, partial [Candidatus Aenigmarchaeota archaeon]|nr:PQQ-binding-like beta-propeller repeat protein [Candidatus Aenigmarchaeota archaeon]